MKNRHAVRDITYASSVQARSGRAVVRVMENTTGRLGLIRRARGYAEDVAAGRDFWEVMVERYGLQLDVVRGSLDNIPTQGPLIVVSNHPYGILDGLMMGYILSARRQGGFRVLANDVFKRAKDLEEVILPVSFEETKEAAKLNLQTRATAMRYLNDGGAVGIFPGGTVSTAARPFDRPMDPSWRTFTAKMISKTDATVVPIFFEGGNSRLFQLASRIHSTLRVGMLIREFKTKINKPVPVVIGDPIAADQLALYKKDPTACMDFLRQATYDLSPRPIDATRLGHEFEAKHKVRDGRGHIR